MWIMLQIKTHENRTNLRAQSVKKCKNIKLFKKIIIIWIIRSLCNIFVVCDICHVCLMQTSIKLTLELHIDIYMNKWNKTHKKVQQVFFENICDNILYCTYRPTHSTMWIKGLLTAWHLLVGLLVGLFVDPMDCTFKETGSSLMSTMMKQM